MEKNGNLVLNRKAKQSVVIDGGIKVTVVRVRSNQVRLSINAPRHVKVMREELLDGANLDQSGNE